MKTPSILALVAVTAFAAEEKKAPEPAAPLTPITTPGWSYEELRRFNAPEARQGVAVDREFFYAIDKFAIGKYRKATGERVAGWEDGDGGEIIHLNAGIVFDGKLHGIHSNYPAVPMLSSLEIFDCATLKHIGTHSFGRMDGSFTWLDRSMGSTHSASSGQAGSPQAGLTAGRRANRWLACFVHYGNKGAEPNRDSAWTQIIEFDDEWRRTAAWALPPELIARFGGRGYSASGGAFGPGGHLYLTGHDNPELYVVTFPRAGSVMKWIATIPISAEGQAFCFDPSQPGVLYTVLKRTKEVIVGRVKHP